MEAIVSSCCKLVHSIHLWGEIPTEHPSTENLPPPSTSPPQKKWLFCHPLQQTSRPTGGKSFEAKELIHLQANVCILSWKGWSLGNGSRMPSRCLKSIQKTQGKVMNIISTYQ